jgi:meiotically up-regulated gene 157 (Mug157) protein
MEKGYGNCIPYRKLRTLWEEIMEICKSERESWTFKRDTTWKSNTNINNGEGSSIVEGIMAEEDSRNDPTEQMNSTKWVSPKSNF